MFEKGVPYGITITGIHVAYMLSAVLYNHVPPVLPKQLKMSRAKFLRRPKTNETHMLAVSVKQ